MWAVECILDIVYSDLLPLKNVWATESSVIHVVVNGFVIENLSQHRDLEANKKEGKINAEMTKVVRDIFAIFHTV